MTATEISQMLGLVGGMAQALPAPEGKVISALALLGQRACAINPSDPVKVVEDASLALVEAAARAKYGV